MNHLKTLVIAMVITLASFSAFSANSAKGIYENDAVGLKQCLDDAKNGAAAGYKPSTNNPLTDKTFKKKVVGKGGRCLTGAYVREDKDSPVTRGVVYVAEGFVYGEQKSTKGSSSFRMWECSNPFDAMFAVETPQPKVSLTVNQVIERTELTKELVVRDVVICKDRDGNTHPPKMDNGKQVCETTMINRFIVQPEVKVLAPKIEVAPTPAYVPPSKPADVPHGTAPTSATDCSDCGPAVKLDHKEARTDGRCVVAFKDPAGAMHYARFDTKRGTSLLVAARVDDVRGEWNRTYMPTYVGYIANGEKKTVELSGTPDCNAVYKAISHPAVLAWTGPRLGLTPDCVPVGKL